MIQRTLDTNWTLAPCSKEAIKKHTPFFEEYENLAITLPTDFHSVLKKNSIIPDPYWGKNELELQWIGEHDWIIKKTLRIETNELAYKHAFLRLENVDTIASLYINDVRVQEFNNQFRIYNLDIRPYLNEGENEIIFKFDSSVRAAIDEAAKLDYPIPYAIYPVHAPHRNLIRKTQCHSGWDWGPCYMTAGIYNTPTLLFTNEGYISYIKVTTQKSSTSWDLKYTLGYQSVKQQQLDIRISCADHIIKEKLDLDAGELIINRTLSFPHNEKDIQEWFPNGMGEQPLYELKTTIGEAQDTRKIGFREIHVERENGAFRFFINGLPIFAKGANWIPLDAIFGNYSIERYNSLLSACKDAHMNMIRVWGGGHYERKEFYELCDEKGILIWQDAMFSCSMYPSTPSFLENVEQEIKDQVRRIQYHPCLALWCGNNEDLGAITWFEESRKNRDRYLVDYDRLNEGVLHRIIKREDPKRFWWPSSPCAGENDYSDNWHDDSKGDMHFWSVWHEAKSFEEYYSIRPRFVSEFGYQSFPSLHTIKSYALQSDWNLTSPIMEHHQKNPRGNTIILENFARYFRLPVSFKKQVYLSQVQQALAMKMAIEYFRSLSPYCAGALYWQINDVWPVASWSSIDYEGNFKALHYEAKRIFAPLLLTIRITEDKAIISYANDINKPYANTNIRIKISCYDGTLVEEKQLSKNLEKLTAGCIEELNLQDYDKSKHFIQAEIIYNNVIIASAYAHMDLPKRSELQDSQLSYHAGQDEKGYYVELSTKVPAFNLMVETSLGGNFSDNNILLIGSKKLYWQSLLSHEEEPSIEEFSSSITVHDLYSSSRE